MARRYSLVAGRAAGAALLASWLVLCSGCGLSGKPSGQVEGTVTLKGQPITEGNVIFLLKEKGIGATASINSTGKFAFESPLAVGTYSVSVTPLPPQPVAPGKAVPRVTTEIPFKYQTPESSGLSFTVKPGANDYSITLGN